MKSGRFFCLVLALAIMVSALPAAAISEQTDVTVSIINLNVAGLPKSFNIADNQKQIAEYINEKAFDIVAVQEDFGYHRSLVKGLDGYDYMTVHSGTIPGGDGLNIFTRDMPIFNEARYPWLKTAGPISEADVLSPKGMLHTVLEIADGIYVDFYNIHADAYSTPESIEARESNYDQIMDLVEENYERYNRPVIITGDFNHRLHAKPEQNSNMYAFFHARGGLKDAWVEVCNGGNYKNFDKWKGTGRYWGSWDSVEKFLYKSGGGITVEAVDFKYKWVTGESGENLSDHAAAECTFKFTVEERPAENTQELTVTRPKFMRNFLNNIKWLFKDLWYAITHFDEIVELIAPSE